MKPIDLRQRTNNTKGLLNPEKLPLTPEKLRALSGMHYMTDEEAHDIIVSIRAFAGILYSYVNWQNSLGLNEQVIDNDSETSKQAA